MSEEREREMCKNVVDAHNRKKCINNAMRKEICSMAIAGDFFFPSFTMIFFCAIKWISLSLTFLFAVNKKN
jgi:hypothetical protein